MFQQHDEQGTALHLEEGAEEAAEDLSEIDDVKSIFCLRPSRPSNDHGWLDSDHYSQLDLPTDSYTDGEWKERYTDLDEIQINGAIRRQWIQGQKEIRQIVSKCTDVLGKDEVRREDFVEHIYGFTSPLFEVFRERLGWNHKATVTHLSLSDERHVSGAW